MSIAGNIREASQLEINRWHNRVNAVRSTKGHALMWAPMKIVRDITFTKFEPVHLGTLTSNTWKPFMEK